mgnify:CR=1 FL=1
MTDVDLLVAGAGGGLAGALRAADLGASVLLVDASEHFRRGNNTSMSTAMFPGAGSRWQRAEGIEDSPETFSADIMKKTKGSADRLMVKTLTEVSAELVEWMADAQGVELSLVTNFHYPGHSVDRCHTIEGRKGDRVLQHLRDDELSFGDEPEGLFAELGEQLVEEDHLARVLDEPVVVGEGRHLGPLK